MRAASATERILLVDEGPQVLQRAARKVPAWPSNDELDDTARRLPDGDRATERWESVVFLVLGLAGIIALGLAAFNAL